MRTAEQAHSVDYRERCPFRIAYFAELRHDLQFRLKPPSSPVMLSKSGGFTRTAPPTVSALDLNDDRPSATGLTSAQPIKHRVRPRVVVERLEHLLEVVDAAEPGLLAPRTQDLAP